MSPEHEDVFRLASWCQLTLCLFQIIVETLQRREVRRRSTSELT